MKADFDRRVKEALADKILQGALDQNAIRRQEGSEAAYASLPEVDLLRQQAREIRVRTVTQLDLYLSQFMDQAEKNGYQVHWAENAIEACSLITAIAQEAGASVVAKSKSMVTEELEVNQALESVGLAVIETDLGEFIIQLRGEKPAHIITPAVHLTRQQVAETFTSELKTPYDPDVEKLTNVARRYLRKTFLSAQVGISGVNFGVAESGSLCLVTNEGNGRMVTTLPPVHIAVMGIERLVPTLDDLAIMLELLPRSATGQVISRYVSLLQGPRRPGDPDGARERHLVLVDNGRTAMAQSDLWEALLCIRCGACLNVCPVFREIGGHAYGSVYPGPIGSVVSPGLFGIDEYGHLAKASTLCGACQEVCPIHIDLPGLLLTLRDQKGQRSKGTAMGWIMKFLAWVAESPSLYSWAQRWSSFVGRIFPSQGGWLTTFPPAWRHSRHFPALPVHTFRASYLPADSTDATIARKQKPDVETFPIPRVQPQVQPQDIFQRSLEDADGEIVFCTQDQVAQRIAEFIQSESTEELIAWENESKGLGEILAHLQTLGIEVIHPKDGESADDPDRVELERLEQVRMGLTGAQAGLADSGTIVEQSGKGRSQLASLLPEIHVAVLHSSDIYNNRRQWMAQHGRKLVRESAVVNLITGPSRTADIEMTLTVGVHGPTRLIVFCLTDV
jgi:L-lactate dehydrogenase complex protein LldF